MQNMANDLGWDEDDIRGPTPMVPEFGRPRFTGDFRNNRYFQAYGSYSGGYGPRPRPLLSLQPFTGMSPFPAGRGRNPRGPPPLIMPHDDNASKYLLRCGVPKESVRNLPNALLQLIEPHYCGLCGQNFDGFHNSRLHYVSKNHLKAQKRWLSQKSGVGFRKEVPLKARELYCELCDVHITSQSHGDSHYAGRNHRAIVEGRKSPKNPALLQKPMEERLKQLIRREKKYLTMTKESEPANETLKEPRSIQNELYCKICKTSMSSAEQMTIHLNGKKHLSKEKQHIMKVMNLRPEQGDNIEIDEEEGTEPTPIKEEIIEKIETSSDWGDGTGKWEEN